MTARLIANDRQFTLEEICDLKHDQALLLAERVKDELVAALKSEPPSTELDAAIKAIEAWDNTTAAASRGGALFSNWWERYYDRGVGKLRVPWNASEPMTTPRGLADTARAVAKFYEAMLEVNSRYGRPDVSWGEVHRIRKGKVDLEVSGGSGIAGAFRVLEFRKEKDGKLAANGGDGWVFAVEFSDPPKAYTVVAYSQSDVEGSPHFSDQAELFSANKMKRAAFTDAEIQAQLIKTYHRQAPASDRFCPVPSACSGPRPKARVSSSSS